MASDLEVDTSAVRAWAAALSATGARISTDPPPSPPAPRWSATDAASAAAGSAERQLRSLVVDIASAARQASAAADGYEDADDRAAARLRSVR